ncbi:MAG: DUF4157 domain-containing protein [Chitinophagaceae bacterium]|nr:DUF4157 domain-containing protein [Chitinophagaceae bacterium]
MFSGAEKNPSIPQRSQAAANNLLEIHPYQGIRQARAAGHTQQSAGYAQQPAVGALQAKGGDLVQAKGKGVEQGPGNGTGMPDYLKTNMESMSGIDLSDVKVHYNSSQPAQLNALAYAQGSNIHIGPGQEQHLPHEAWHVVQQKQGRVSPTIQLKGIGVNDDPELESEADRMGDAAMRTITVQQKSTSSADMPLRSMTHVGGATVLQPKLGFEIEMLVLVDDNGRPVPEKEELGRYGTHCNLVVDHSGAVASPTPTAAQEADHDVAMAEGYKRWWHHPGTGALYESKQDAEAAHGVGNTDELYFNAQTGITLNKADDALDWEVQWLHRASGANYATEALARTAHPLPEVIEKQYHQRSTGTDQAAHPHRAELGTGEYASIIEIVTDADAPETVGGRAAILQSMTEARTLANAIHARNPRTTRFKLNAVAPGLSDRYYVGNTSGTAGANAQTVNGSIQSNFGIALSEVAAFVEKVLNRNQGGQQIAGYGTPNFKVKHHTDVVDPTHDEGDVVRAELVAAAANAQTIVNAINNPGAVPLPNLKGLMIIVCQYLRLGKVFYNHGYDGTGFPNNTGLVKNMIPLMARTDMSVMFRDLVPAVERNVLNADIVATLPNILAVTGRTTGRALLNDPAEQTNTGALAAWGGIYVVGVDQFVSNVFTQGQDGVMTLLGNIRPMGPEKVDPSGWTRHQPALLPEYYAHPLHPNQPNRPAAYKEGAVFELRNMVPLGSGAAGVDRFLPATWPGIARYFSAFLDLQHNPPPPPVVAPPAPLPPIPPGAGAPGPAPGGNAQRCGCCFITTACVRSRGLPDDCEELEVLRRLRDNYMLKSKEGERMIAEYYDLAPRIVDLIDKREDAAAIYDDLYSVIRQCVMLVKSGQYKAAVEVYKYMMIQLVGLFDLTVL